MNDKTKDLSQQQDSEELLVTSTSSSVTVEESSLVSSLTEGEIIEPDTSTDETTTTVTGADTATSATTTTTPIGTGTGVVYQVVTSSTGNNNFIIVNNEDDSIASIDDRLTEGSGGSSSSSSGGSNEKIINCGSPTMGGTSSNNDAETCVLSKNSNYIEQTNENSKNMVITRSGSNSAATTEFSLRSSSSSTTTSSTSSTSTATSSSSSSSSSSSKTSSLVDVLVNATTSSLGPSTMMISAPTTRSKRKLMNESGGTNTLNRTNSISLNNKTIKLDIKNHQSPMTTRKSLSATSINSVSHHHHQQQQQGERIKSDEKQGAAGSESMITAKIGSIATSKQQQISTKVILNKDDNIANTSSNSSSSSCSSNPSTNKVILKLNNCLNDLASYDKVEESHHSESSKNDSAICTMSTTTTIATTTTATTSTISTIKTTTTKTADDNEETDSTTTTTSRIKLSAVSSCDNDDKNLNSSGSSGECRKVEPLKINLNRDRDNVKTKIIIKPIVKPTINVDSENPGSPIPKLTIKSPANSNILTISSGGGGGGSSVGDTIGKVASNGSEQQQLPPSGEPHIVPKLTIRANECNSSLTNSDTAVTHTVVPKLTIKMDGVINCIKESPSTLNSSPSSSSSSSSSASTSPSPPLPPLPKLTIKTTGDIAESIITTHSPKSSMSSQCHIVSTSTAISSVHSPTPPQQITTTVPKLTIKPIPKPSTSTNCSDVSCISPIPKVTIKPIPLPSATTTESSSCNDSDGTDEADNAKQQKKITIVATSTITTPPTTVPKLTIRTGIEPSVIIQHSEINNTVPKLTIRTISENSSNNGGGGVGGGGGGDCSEKIQTIPKFTIKTSSLLVQDSCSSAQQPSIPKLTIAVNDTTTTTTTTNNLCISPNNSEKTVPKLTIRQVEKDDSTTITTVDRIPKLMISSIHECENVDKVPKITIKQVQDSDTVEKIPKITIKSISESDDLERIPKLTIKNLFDNADHVEKVPKLTIRQIQEESEDGEKVPKLKVTTVQDSEMVSQPTVPKITIKQIQQDGGSNSEDKVPKLTIISKSVCDDNTLKIRKLKIKPIQEFSSSSSPLPSSSFSSSMSKMVSSSQIGQGSPQHTGTDRTDRMSKLEVRQLEPLDGEKIPKLTIRQVQQESEKDGRIPKLTIVQSSNSFDFQIETNREAGASTAATADGHGHGHGSRIKSPKRTNNEENYKNEDIPSNKSIKLTLKNDHASNMVYTFRKKEEESETKTKTSLAVVEDRVLGKNDGNKDKKNENFDQEDTKIMHTELEQQQKIDQIIECSNDEKLNKMELDSGEDKYMNESNLQIEKQEEKILDSKKEIFTENDDDDNNKEINRPEVPEVETIDLESEPEIVNGEQEQGNTISSYVKEDENEGEEDNLVSENGNGFQYDEPDPSILAAFLDLDQDPDVIYVEQDSQETIPSCESKQNSSNIMEDRNTDRDDGDGTVQMVDPCNIPIKDTPSLEDATNLFSITVSVDLTTPSPGSTPVHLINDDSSQKTLSEEGINECSRDVGGGGDRNDDVRMKFHPFETIELPSSSVDDLVENCKDDGTNPSDFSQVDALEGQKLFEVNCAPISTESTLSPKIFSEQIIIENSNDMSIPSEGQLANLTSGNLSLYRGEDQSKSTENSSEPAHLDEKFLSNVDVLSCLGITNSTTYNVIDTDEVLRRNNNKEVTTTATTERETLSASISIGENSNESNQSRSNMKRCSESPIISPDEDPPSKKMRCNIIEDAATQNTIPDCLSSNSETCDTLLVQTVSVECTSSTVVKESSNNATAATTTGESEISCDEKFSALMDLEIFEDEINSDKGATIKDVDKSSINVESSILDDDEKLESNTNSSQNDSSGNLSKDSLESKNDIIHEMTQDNIEMIRTKQNVLLINEESGSDGMLVDECTSDPLSGISNPIIDDKKNQEIDSGVDISSSVKSESVPEVPVKRPRGRPRKDGRPAGSVKKQEREKKQREDNSGLMTVRRKFKGVLLEAQKVTEIVTQRKRADKLKGSLKSQKIISSPTIDEIQKSSMTTTTPISITSVIDALTAVTSTTTVTSIASGTSPVMANSPMTVSSAVTVPSGMTVTSPMLTTSSELITPVSGAETMTGVVLQETTINSTSATLQEFTPESIDEKTEISTLMTTPVRPLRGRGSRGGRISRSVGRGRGRGGRGRIALINRNRPRGIGGLTHTPDKDGSFFSPERRKTLESKTSATGTLQVFEEDTRMSAELISTPGRQSEILNNEDTQSSMQSSLSVIEGGVGGGAGGSSSTVKKQRAKMEVIAPEGKTEYTVDMIAEYDWPPPKGCCPAKNRDTFMIQEQIAQYLGIKSFKRKYPDLPRRQIDMEERNYLREKGLVTEKMCDLGITAVWASDVLDIMYSDFYDKYEEYKNYLRQKQTRDIEAKQKALAAEAVDKGLQARERALQSASKWNCNFNKARKEDRRLCLDLQSLIIQIPSAVGKKLSRPVVTQQQPPPPSHYPVALVPGQFTEYYRTYTPQELRCYPINTVIEQEESDSLNDRLKPKVEINDDESSDSSDSSSDSSYSGSETESCSEDSDSDSSTLSDEDEPPDGQLKCYVCSQPQNKNRHGMPEVFIQCVTCRRRTHPSCIEMPRRMVNRVRNYNWQCAECKCCIKCKRKQEENKMLFCEQCDRGYHIYCLQIKNIPEGRWHCERCAVCMRCGARKPEGNLPPPTPPPPPPPDEEKVVDKKKKWKKKSKWVHEYKIDHLTKIREHFSILCMPCARLKTNRPKS